MGFRFTYDMDAQDGAYTYDTRIDELCYHQLSFDSNGPVTGGTITVEAKSAGTDLFEPVPDGVFELTNPRTILFTFAAAELRFTVADLTGTAIQLHITHNWSEL